MYLTLMCVSNPNVGHVPNPNVCNPNVGHVYLTLMFETLMFVPNPNVGHVYLTLVFVTLMFVPNPNVGHVPNPNACT